MQKDKEGIRTQNERFNVIYRDNISLLRSIARGRGIVKDEVEDMLQETFLLYYRCYPLTWPENQIRSYLAKILKNLCIDQFRKNAAHPVFYIDPSVLGWYYRGDKGDPLDILISRQRYREVREAFQSMKEEWAVVFFWYAVQDLTMKEIGRRLGISESACRMRLMRGRRFLNERLR